MTGRELVGGRYADPRPVAWIEEGRWRDQAWRWLAMRLSTPDGEIHGQAGESISRRKIGQGSLVRHRPGRLFLQPQRPGADAYQVHSTEISLNTSDLWGHRP